MIISNKTISHQIYQQKKADIIPDSALNNIYTVPKSILEHDPIRILTE